MAKALIITEKPSVARDIVEALGGFTAKSGGAYWESDRYICSFAVGHIFSFLEPEEIDRAYRSWNIALLPIIPKSFQLKPVPGHEQRIKILRSLIERSDVNCLINACDAAREGELIFREIVDFVGAKQWVRRLWLQSMTVEAIRAGFQSLRDGTDLDGLGAAAECRARSDWLIGMNATRAFSQRLRTRSERVPWSVGRVQTPTLALLVDRELQILGHKPRPYWRLTVTFDAGDHTYEGTWFDPKFRASETQPDLRDDRIFDQARAQDTSASLDGATGIANETRDESLRHAPYLFHLTGLQKYMAQRYKWTSKRTLEAAQRCYESHKVITYPRTSSQCLPSDYRAEVDRLVKALAGHDIYGDAASNILKNGRCNDKRTFNDAGVSDHFAIIPTGKSKALSGDDGKLYDAVVRRFLATFYPPAVYDRVKRITVSGGQHFRTGPLEALRIPGWLSVYARQTEDGSAKELPPLRQKDAVVGITNRNLKDEVTKPPLRINEAGLLSLMEHAGRQIDNEELQAALNGAEGLGTAATRADIIQNLKTKEYVDETLRPTFKGIHLILTLQRLNVVRLTSPELTARLELELAEVESGKRLQAAFMTEISRYTTEVVNAAKKLEWQQVYPDERPLGDCPICSHSGSQFALGVPKVFERNLYYACATVTGPNSGCGFRVWKEISGRYLDRNNAEQLIGEGATSELDGFRTKSKQDYKARLELRSGKVVVCGLEGDAAADEDPFAQPESRRARGGERGRRGSTQSSRQGASKAAGDEPAAERVVVADCPVHPAGCQVVETRGAYVCTTRLAAFARGEQKPSGLMIPRILCKRELTQAEVKSLIQARVTDELQDFTSKFGRPFNARLQLTPEGGIAFVFAERSTNTYERKSQPSKFRRQRFKSQGARGARER